MHQLCKQACTDAVAHIDIFFFLISSCTHRYSQAFIRTVHAWARATQLIE